MLPVADAQKRILAACAQLPIENVSLENAYGRVLAEDAVAIRDLPPWNGSAMDGYAVRAAELPGRLPIAATVAAGDPGSLTLSPGSCMKIMTGAPVPAGAESVVMREEVSLEEGMAVFAKAPNLGSHIRKRGEDVTAGSVYLRANTAIGHGELALLAAQSCTRVPVRRKARVVVLSTGNELVPPNTEPRPGQIISSNNLTLCSQIVAAGAEAIDAGIVPDNQVDIERALRALSDYDVLLTSGGVSVGDFDFVKEAFESTGVEVDFWKVAVKPGKPLVFGRRDSQLVFGLPGNPVSTFVTFELFVRPALLSMQGVPPSRPRVRAKLRSAISKKPGRAHYLRCALEYRDGQFYATANRKQGSGTLSSMNHMDGLIELPAEIGDVEENESVDVLCFELPTEPA